MTIETEQLFDHLKAHTGGRIDRKGEVHIDCPFCHKPAKDRQTHFSYALKGYCCHVCGESGGLPKLASILGLSDGMKDLSHPSSYRTKQTTKTEREDSPPKWAESIETLVSQYAAAPDAISLWQAYKPLLTVETIVQYRLGVGCLPRQMTRRLILPIWQGSTLVTTHLRGRLLPEVEQSESSPKWIAASGSKGTVFITRDGLRPGHWVVVVEQPVDAILIHQQFPMLDVIAPTNGVGALREIVATLRAGPNIAGVIVAFDNDLAGLPNQITAEKLQQDRKKAGLPALTPNGPKLIKALRKIGIKVVEKWHWLDGAAEKADIGWLLEQPSGMDAFLLQVQCLLDKHHEILADMIVNQRYISEINRALLIQSSTWAIRSPIGTGKTELIRYIQEDLACELGHAPKVLAVSYLEVLLNNMATRLGHESYKNCKSRSLKTVSQLSCCLNSLCKLAEFQDPLPCYDLVVVDEVEQVLAALGGDTFQSSQALFAKTILEHLIKTARFVVCMDAFLSPVALHWLKQLRPDMRTIINLYKPPTPKPMFVYQTKEATIAKADQLIEEDMGPVLIAMNSRSEAKRLYKRYQDHYGSETVLLISQDTTKYRTTQESLMHINAALNQIRVLIYTPSMGSGFDITIPVRAVIGLFNHQPLDAPSCLQMLGRARNTPEVHVWIQKVSGRTETDPVRLFDRYYQGAQETKRRVHLHFDLNETGRLQMTSKQEGFLRLLCEIEGRHNASTNRLYENILALAKDIYQLTVVDEIIECPQLKQDLKACQKQIAEIDQKATLSSKSLDDRAYEEMCRNGQLTPELEAGHIRWQIEDTYQQAITPELYEAYIKGGRDQLLNFIVFHSSIDEVARLDKEELDRSTEYHRMKHHAAHYLFARKMFLELGCLSLEGGFDANTLFDKEQIADAFFHVDVPKAGPFYWRPDYSKDPVSRLRQVLKSYGLKLKTVRSRKGNCYHIEEDSLKTMWERAICRLAGLNKRRAVGVQNHGVYIPSLPQNYTLGCVTLLRIQLANGRLDSTDVFRFG